MIWTAVERLKLDNERLQRMAASVGPFGSNTSARSARGDGVLMGDDMDSSPDSLRNGNGLELSSGHSDPTSGSEVSSRSAHDGYYKVPQHSISPHSEQRREDKKRKKRERKMAMSAKSQYQKA